MVNHIQVDSISVHSIVPTGSIFIDNYYIILLYILPVNRNRSITSYTVLEITECIR